MKPFVPIHPHSGPRRRANRRLVAVSIAISVCLASTIAFAADSDPSAVTTPPPRPPELNTTAPATPAEAVVATAPSPPNAPAASHDSAQQPVDSHKIRVATAATEPRECDPCERDEEAAEGAGAFVVGPGQFDFSSLNDHLVASGYERLNNLMTIIGGDGHAVFDSGFVAGARGGALVGPSGTGPGVRTHLAGGFGMVNFGFAPVRTTHFLFTVTGGIGGYGLSLGIGDDQSVPFDSVLRSPRHSASLSHAGLLLGLTMGADFRVPIGRVERGRRGFFTLGVRVAGLYGPPLGEWNVSNGGEATGGPRTGLTGGYGAIAIGFGGGSTRTSNKASSH
jgi:hypothetical protein